MPNSVDLRDQRDPGPWVVIITDAGCLLYDEAGPAFEPCPAVECGGCPVRVLPQQGYLN